MMKSCLLFPALLAASSLSLKADASAPIDPNLYNTGPALQDILRVVGTQEANLGGISGGTATESSIAEASRQSTLSSASDELDDMLSEVGGACSFDAMVQCFQNKMAGGEKENID